MLQAERKKPRALRHEDNDKRILEAALELVAEGGFDGLSMSRLAEAVGFTPGALYRYIQSKDALLSRIMEAALADVGASLDSAVALLPAGASPLARVFALALAYRSFAHEKPHQFGLLAMAMAEPRVLLREPEHAAVVVGQMVSALGLLSQALEASAAAGCLQKGDVAERTVCLFALLQGVLQLHKQARYARSILDLDRLAVSGVSTLLIGWGAERRDVEQALETVKKTLRSTASSPGGAL